MTNLLDLTNAPDKAAVAQTNFERLDTIPRFESLLLKNDQDNLYYKFVCTTVDGIVVFTKTADAGIA